MDAPSRIFDQNRDSQFCAQTIANAYWAISDGWSTIDDKPTYEYSFGSVSTLAICTKPLARQGYAFVAVG
jgi:hypothetical protein